MAGKWRISYFSADTVDQSLFRYAVIVAAYRGSWIFVRQKTRETFELPAGRREPGETIDETARRELWEETGALEYDLRPVCAFHVGEQQVAADQLDDKTPCGMLYYAEVRHFGTIPATSEISEKILCGQLPGSLSYPDVQPELFCKAQRTQEAQGKAQGDGSSGAC